VPSRTHRLLAAAAVLAATVTAVFAAAPANAAAPHYPVLANLGQGIAASLPNPAGSPAGVNVASCQPSAAHPRPVVLITGTFGNMIDDWSGLGPTLANRGYCVYSTTIGGSPKSVIQTTGAVATSAGQISAFVDQVRSRTGAGQVDLIGHSQGGLIGEYYLKILNGAGKVHSFVGLSPTTHGTTLSGLALLAKAFGVTNIVGAACPACADQVTGSDLVNALNAGPVAQPGVSYTIIETRNEFVVTPAGAAAFIAEPGVSNLWLQNSCPFSATDHADLSYDKGVYDLVGNALDPGHPQPVHCV
jgi:triacylglycerol esterase/lipase EstA (alpha/beta hydrolase family)